MSNNLSFVTAGGLISCTQCQAISKRTKQQCRAPPAKGKPSADSIAGAQQALRHPNADNVAPTLKPSMAMKRAKREQNGHKLCADFAL